MNIEKIRNLGPDELLKEQREGADQLFRLKFQLKMGQTTGVKKMRELRKDLARLKTIARERELGILQSRVENATTGAVASSAQEVAPAATRPVKKTASKKSAAGKAKKTAGKRKLSASPKQAAANNKNKKKSKAKK